MRDKKQNDIDLPKWVWYVSGFATLMLLLAAAKAV